MITFLWKQPPAHPILADDEVHVWCAALDQPLERMLALARTLSADEAKRAERLVFERDRHHFIVGRGFLRTRPRKLRFYAKLSDWSTSTGPWFIC